MSNTVMQGKLRVSWCQQCFGTGRGGKHKCKACSGKRTTTACPNVRSHKLKIFEFGRISPKRPGKTPSRSLAAIMLRPEAKIPCST
jgi:hypothetical protein